MSWKYREQNRETCPFWCINRDVVWYLYNDNETLLVQQYTRSIWGSDENSIIYCSPKEREQCQEILKTHYNFFKQIVIELKSMTFFTFSTFEDLLRQLLNFYKEKDDSFYLFKDGKIYTLEVSLSKKIYYPHTMTGPRGFIGKGNKEDKWNVTNFLLTLNPTSSFPILSLYIDNIGNDPNIHPIIAIGTCLFYENTKKKKVFKFQSCEDDLSEELMTELVDKNWSILGLEESSFNSFFKYMDKISQLKGLRVILPYNIEFLDYLYRKEEKGKPFVGIQNYNKIEIDSIYIKNIADKAEYELDKWI